MLKLNIGCGSVYLEGWINIDIESETADLHHDMRTPLPYHDNSVDFIYNEHFIEHLTAEEGVRVMKEFHRVLKPEGVLRIATPDLRYVLFRYFFFWRSQDWIQKWHRELKTRAEMINKSFYSWEHRYLYDSEELRRRLGEAGFTRLSKKSFGKSDYSELRGLETRRDSRLIIEAIKR
jgi:predicted SAM-dependent methyltransferase